MIRRPESQLVDTAAFDTTLMNVDLGPTDYDQASIRVSTSVKRLLIEVGDNSFKTHNFNAALDSNFPSDPTRLGLET